MSNCRCIRDKPTHVSRGLLHHVGAMAADVVCTYLYTGTRQIIITKITRVSYKIYLSRARTLNRIDPEIFCYVSK